MPGTELCSCGLHKCCNAYVVRYTDIHNEKTTGKIAEYMKLDESQINSLLPKFNYTVDITEENIDSLNDTIRLLYKVKRIPEVFDISDYIM